MYKPIRYQSFTVLFRNQTPIFPLSSWLINLNNRWARGYQVTVLSLCSCHFKECRASFRCRRIPLPPPCPHPGSRTFSYGTYAFYHVIRIKAKRNKRGSARRVPCPPAGESTLFAQSLTHFSRLGSSTLCLPQRNESLLAGLFWTHSRELKVKLWNYSYRHKF